MVRHCKNRQIVMIEICEKDGSVNNTIENFSLKVLGLVMLSQSFFDWF